MLLHDNKYRFTISAITQRAPYPNTSSFTACHTTPSLHTIAATLSDSMQFLYCHTSSKACQHGRIHGSVIAWLRNPRTRCHNRRYFAAVCDRSGPQNTCNPRAPAPVLQVSSNTWAIQVHIYMLKPIAMFLFLTGSTASQPTTLGGTVELGSVGTSCYV